MRTFWAAILLAGSLCAQDTERYYALYRTATDTLDRDPALTVEICFKGISLWPESERYFWPLLIEADARLGIWEEVFGLGARAVREIEAGRLLARLDQEQEETSLRNRYAEALDRKNKATEAARQRALANHDATDPSIASILKIERERRWERARSDLLETEFDQVMSSVRFKTLDGNDIALENYRGKIVILAFWATWCTPCVDELHQLNMVASRVRDRAEIITVNADDSVADIRAFAKKNSLTLPILTRDAANHDLVAQFDVLTIPRLFAIDGDGHMRFRLVGYDPDGLLPVKIDWIVTRLAHGPN